MDEVYFHRALFLSWYCSKGDCSFCFMSTEKPRITEPKKALRHPSSILAEALICRLCDWKIEFLSGGYESYTLEDLKKLILMLKSVYPDKLWLNMGVLPNGWLKKLSPYIKGVVGAVETINPIIHDKVCPSKPIDKIIPMLDEARALGLRSAMTIIIGLGETIEDYPLLKRFISDHNISRITFYALIPHERTPYSMGPDKSYYASWISTTRKDFADIEIIAGTWHDRLDELHLLLDAGADGFTKFKSIKLYGSTYAEQIKKELEMTGKTLKSRFSGTLPKDISKYIADLPANYKNKLIPRYMKYLEKMNKS